MKFNSAKWQMTGLYFPNDGMDNPLVPREYRQYSIIRIRENIMKVIGVNFLCFERRQRYTT